MQSGSWRPREHPGREICASVTHTRNAPESDNFAVVLIMQHQEVNEAIWVGDVPNQPPMSRLLLHFWMAF